MLIFDSSEGSNSGVPIGNEGHMYITICYMFTAMGVKENTIFVHREIAPRVSINLY